VVWAVDLRVLHPSVRSADGSSSTVLPSNPAEEAGDAQVSKQPTGQTHRRSFIEAGLEKFLFASRWFLAPFYIGLAAALVLVLARFCMEFYNLARSGVTTDAHTFTLDLLEMLDLVLIANLILIVVFAGYENFVSKIEAARGDVDRPHWMGTIDFTGLKLKLIGSLVAISVIELLKDFIQLGEHEGDKVGQGVMWRVVIHVVFVVSGVLFALMDLIAAKIGPGHGVDEFGG
jgi:uncharacterized protein (TIGR00645 family)